jgi:DNA-binding LytR/AlgR family response regulator
MTFSCIIVDDDLFAVEQLSEYITMVPSLKLLKAFSDPMAALREIKSLDKVVDFLFTDVEMPGISGLKLASEIRGKINFLVLISGHLRYAAEGYDINAKRFINKPFDFKKFNKVVEDIILTQDMDSPYIVVKLSGKNQAIKIFINKIIAIEGASNYIKIHTVDRVYMPYSKLAQMEESLKGYNFKRISKSVIIHSKYIERINGYNISLRNNLEFSVGESYQKEFNLYFSKIIKN